MMNFDWKSIVKTAAPLLGGALGGPLAGTAVKLLADTLLPDDKKTGTAEQLEAHIQDALKVASPEVLAQVQAAEQEFKIKLRELNIKEEEVHAKDRDSARRRQVDMGDWTPSVLGVLIVLGFFGLLVSMMVYDMPDKNATVLNIMLGALGTMTASVTAYFFGSSKGSADKNKIMAGRG